VRIVLLGRRSLGFTGIPSGDGLLEANVCVSECHPFATSRNEPLKSGGADPIQAFYRSVQSIATSWVYYPSERIDLPNGHPAEDRPGCHAAYLVGSTCSLLQGLGAVGVEAERFRSPVDLRHPTLIEKGGADFMSEQRFLEDVPIEIKLGI